ncbi:helix-turn-helix domain-containing protein [Streptomyces sp. NPDC059398]|uniref:helix-turn-helix domain-containing protein n=1 Tax=Streptomyces sp. NPDC059398 TaxID=3346820 RepID=UPI00369BD691
MCPGPFGGGRRLGCASHRPRGPGCDSHCRGGRVRLPLLRAAGELVTETAVACGWSNPSSFIDAFTEVVGETPGRYQADLRSRR